MRMLVLVLVLACHASRPAPAPRRVLHVPRDVGALVTERAAFAAFAREVRSVVGDTPDADELFVLSMLDALDEAWPAAVEKLDRIAAAEPDANVRVMRGLTIRVWAATIAGAPFREALAARVDRLPDEVKPDLSELRAMATVFTPEVCAQLVRENVGPHVRDGTVPAQDAHLIVFQRYAVVRLVPVAKDIDAVLAARGIALPQE